MLVKLLSTLSAKGVSQKLLRIKVHNKEPDPAAHNPNC
jgi:hypothetical protein